ncbi:MAG: hypothetical protein LBR18_06225 [Tannerella sp.]|nr:hypothetical protein [Tannerella sp.]
MKRQCLPLKQTNSYLKGLDEIASLHSLLLYSLAEKMTALRKKPEKGCGYISTWHYAV